MKKYCGLALLSAAFVLSACAWTHKESHAVTPPEGSALRKEIVEAAKQAMAKHGPKNVVLVAPYLKVHNGWAWIQVNPQSANGKQHYESQSGLFQMQVKKWVLIEWMPAEEGTNYKKYFEKLRNEHPTAPADIFPQ